MSGHEPIPAAVAIAALIGIGGLASMAALLVGVPGWAIAAGWVVGGVLGTRLYGRVRRLRQAEELRKVERVESDGNSVP